jgi:hypothetical protein
MKIFIFSIGLLLHFVSYGQNTLFKQKNKILEFNYGVADSGGLERMNEMEKIKYELKFVEKTFRKSIFNDYTFETEIKIDSNDYEEAWMKLPNKFKYTFNGVAIYDKQGSFLKTMPCTQEQKDDLKSEKEAIALEGYHPVIAAFPVFQANLKSTYQLEGYTYESINSSEFKISKGPSKTTYNTSNLTIIEEYLDEDGIKNKITNGYEAMENNKGFLLKIEKHERFTNLEKGNCVTETKLRYFTNYEFEDNGNLINKTLNTDDQINLFPNPNTGVFTAAIKLKQGVSISSVKIINLRNGQVTLIDAVGKSLIEVNKPDLPSGNYTFQVTTSENKTINANFIKN